MRQQEEREHLRQGKDSSWLEDHANTHTITIFAGRRDHDQFAITGYSRFQTKVLTKQDLHVWLAIENEPIAFDHDASSPPRIEFVGGGTAHLQSIILDQNLREVR